MSAMAYSLAYNAIYIFTECGLTIVLLLIPAVNKAMVKVKSMALEGGRTARSAGNS